MTMPSEVSRVIFRIELVRIEISTTGFATTYLRDLDTNHVFAVPGGYITIISPKETANEQD